MQVLCSACKIATPFRNAAVRVPAPTPPHATRNGQSLAKRSRRALSSHKLPPVGEDLQAAKSARRNNNKGRGDERAHRWSDARCDGGRLDRHAIRCSRNRLRSLHGMALVTRIRAVTVNKVGRAVSSPEPDRALTAKYSDRRQLLGIGAEKPATALSRTSHPRHRCRLHHLRGGTASVAPARHLASQENSQVAQAGIKQLATRLVTNRYSLPWG